MTLDEAIAHARDRAEALRGDRKHECAAEHDQLASWLQELAMRRDQDGCRGVEVLTDNG